MTPNYDDKHHGLFRGETPDDCMEQLRAFRENHDLSKYTRIEIIMIF